MMGGDNSEIWRRNQQFPKQLSSSQPGREGCGLYSVIKAAGNCKGKEPPLESEGGSILLPQLEQSADDDNKMTFFLLLLFLLPHCQVTNLSSCKRQPAQLTVTHVNTRSDTRVVLSGPRPPSRWSAASEFGPPIEVCTQPCRSSRRCMFLLWVEQLH